MSEETEGQDTGAEAVTGGVDPAAVALALGGASREDAEAFLKKQSILADAQTRLVTLQAQELSHELSYLCALPKTRARPINCHRA